MQTHAVGGCISALALLNIIYDANIDIENVIDIFGKKKELSSLLMFVT